MHSTLLLNADAMPVSLLPLSTLTWQDAIGMVWTEQVDVLHEYDDWVVHSPSVAIPVPAVCMLKQQVKVKRVQTPRCPPAGLVFLRDGFVCQYCHKRFPRAALTLDHVLPRVLGGGSTWENLSSACSPCNGRRGHDVRIQPANPPTRPTYYGLVKRLRTLPIRVPHATWNDFLCWDDDLVRLVDPRRRHDKNDEDNFDFS